MLELSLPFKDEDTGAQVQPTRAEHCDPLCVTVLPPYGLHVGAPARHTQEKVLDPDLPARRGLAAPGRASPWLGLGWPASSPGGVGMVKRPHQTEWEPPAGTPNSPGRSMAVSHRETPLE